MYKFMRSKLCDQLGLQINLYILKEHTFKAALLIINVLSYTLHDLTEHFPKPNLLKQKYVTLAHVKQLYFIN